MKKKLILFILIFGISGLLGYRIYTNVKSKEVPNNNQQRNNRMQRAVPITAAKLVKTSLAQKLELNAELEPNIRSDISAKISGVIQNINVSIGDFVKKGAVIIKLDDDEYRENLKNAEIAYNVAKATYMKQLIETNNLKSNYARAKELYESKLISLENYEAAETKYKSAEAALNYYKSQMEQAENQISQAKIKLGYTTITAPFDGYIEKIYLEKGALVLVGKSILSMVDNSQIKAIINVPENYFYYISRGLNTTIKINKINDKYEGIITNVAPSIDVSNKSGRAEITIQNKNNKLKPGLSAAAVIILKTFDNILAAPNEAIYKYQNKHGFFLVNDDKTVKFIECEILVSDDGLTGIKLKEDNIEENAKIVLLGGHLLKDGDNVIISDGSKKTEE
ncbi:MAG TPA: efflux RND transporter periplasmic adaptor subunit, partial [bacterium]|nr:efflux RND transporter periplasmic adaptor subunit [bacterium]